MSGHPLCIEKKIVTQEDLRKINCVKTVCSDSMGEVCNLVLLERVVFTESSALKV